MKKYFCLLFLLTMSFAFAQEAPIFQDAPETLPFIIADSDQDGRGGCGKGCQRYDEPFLNNPEGCIDRDKKTNFMSWTRDKSNFGMEKVFIRFPKKPSEIKTHEFLTKSAFDNVVQYSLIGCYPPRGNIDANVWFAQLILSVSQPPFKCMSQLIYQSSAGDSLLDYTAYDAVNDVVIKARALVTAFNGYIIQCSKPNGTRDHFDYFLDSFYIKCDCSCDVK